MVKKHYQITFFLSLYPNINKLPLKAFVMEVLLSDRLKRFNQNYPKPALNHHKQEQSELNRFTY